MNINKNKIREEQIKNPYPNGTQIKKFSGKPFQSGELIETITV